MPKLVAVILSIPDAVIGAYVVVLIAILFVLGMRIVVNDGMDYRKAAIVGVSFWVGYGFQSGSLFIDQMSPFFAEMLSNGIDLGRADRTHPVRLRRTRGTPPETAGDDAERGRAG